MEWEPTKLVKFIPVWAKSLLIFSEIIMSHARVGRTSSPALPASIAMTTHASIWENYNVDRDRQSYDYGRSPSYLWQKVHLLHNMGTSHACTFRQSWLQYRGFSVMFCPEFLPTLIESITSSGICTVSPPTHSLLQSRTVFFSFLKR